MAAQLNVVYSPSKDREILITDAEYLVRQFCTECGFKPLPYMAREFARWLFIGYEREMIDHAIQLTARAPRPSFAYLNAIIRRSVHCKTYDEFVSNRYRAEDELPWEKMIDVASLVNEELDSMQI